MYYTNIKNLSENFGALWEHSEAVENCRGCNAKFQLPYSRRKHHCRICAGVFCDKCCALPPDSSILFGGGNGSSPQGNTEEINLATMRVCSGKCHF